MGPGQFSPGEAGYSELINEPGQERFNGAGAI